MSTYHVVIWTTIDLSLSFRITKSIKELIALNFFEPFFF